MEKRLCRWISINLQVVVVQIEKDAECEKKQKSPKYGKKDVFFYIYAFIAHMMNRTESHDRSVCVRLRCFLLLKIRDERIPAILAEKCSCLWKPLRRNKVEEIPEAAANKTLKIMEDSPGLGGILTQFPAIMDSRTESRSRSTTMKSSNTENHKNPRKWCLVKKEEGFCLGRALMCGTTHASLHKHSPPNPRPTEQFKHVEATKSGG